MNQAPSSSKRSPYISEMARSEFTSHLSTEERKMKRTPRMADMQIAVTLRCYTSNEDIVRENRALAGDLFELRRPTYSEPQLRRKVVTLRSSVSEGDVQQDTGVYFRLRNEQWQTLTADNQRHQLFQVYLRA
ncbi:hypothetical protein ACHAWO_002004 [Cyclotella atomus]|uniref:Uncharacterized protein n=1 Tax=Cyclotella atomus TaxID=382360 RepID=A0ABD3NZX7_9STRA